MYNLKYYLNYGYYRDSVGVNAASAIMQDILDNAKADIESGKQTIRLSFGHDANLMSLLAYMGVPEFSGHTEDLHSVKEVWQESQRAGVKDQPKKEQEAYFLNGAGEAYQISEKYASEFISSKYYSSKYYSQGSHSDRYSKSRRRSSKRK